MKLVALRQFAIGVNKSRGWPEHSDLDALFAAGYSKRTVLEVVLGTALKILWNDTNHVASTPLDKAFEATAWTPEELRCGERWLQQAQESRALATDRAESWHVVPEVWMDPCLGRPVATPPLARG